MFGCFCLYCDGQAVGWIHDSVLSLREVDLDYLPDDIKRPNKDDTVSDNMAIDSDGDLMMRMGDNMAMDMDSGELHIISGWSSGKEEED